MQISNKTNKEYYNKDSGLNQKMYDEARKTRETLADKLSTEIEGNRPIPITGLTSYRP